VGVAQVKKWMKKDEDGEPAGGFSLSDLRALHRSGKLSLEEYEKTKILIVEAAKAAAKREAEAKEAAKKRRGSGQLGL